MGFAAAAFLGFLPSNPSSFHQIFLCQTLFVMDDLLLIFLCKFPHSLLSKRAIFMPAKSQYPFIHSVFLFFICPIMRFSTAFFFTLNRNVFQMPSFLMNKWPFLNLFFKFILFCGNFMDLRLIGIYKINKSQSRASNHEEFVA